MFSIQALPWNVVAGSGGYANRLKLERVALGEGNRDSSLRTGYLRIPGDRVKRGELCTSFPLFTQAIEICAQCS